VEAAVIAGSADHESGRRIIEVVADETAAARRGAELFAEDAHEAVARRGPFAVALSGGSTPRRLYELLARDPLRLQVPWQQVHLLWGDERCVPPDSQESNYRMAHEAFVGHVPIPPDNVLRIRGEDDPAAAAVAYEMSLRGLGRTIGVTSLGTPIIDLVLLGIGSNGHTASLFPHSPALRTAEQLVEAARRRAAA
jgi:6-phosphogluconolactonase